MGEASAPLTRWDVFVSYARADALNVHALVTALQKAGLRVWFDQQRIDTFDGITDRLEEGIANATVVLMCLSSTYPSRPACQWEALQVLRRIPTKEIPQRLLTVAVDPAVELGMVWPLLSDLQLPQAPTAATAANWTDPDVWRDTAAAVRKAAEGTLTGTAARQRPPIGPAPDRGVLWLPQAPAQSPAFTGRFREMLELHSLLASEKVGLGSGRAGTALPVEIVGMGGVGKSLLAQEYAHHFAGAWPIVVRISALGDKYGHRLVEEERAAWLADLRQGFDRVTASLQSRLPGSPSTPTAIPEASDPIAAARAGVESARAALATLLERAWTELTGARGGPRRGSAALWVVDDVPDGVGPDIDLLTSPMPDRSGTIITTRSTSYGSRFARLSLDCLDPDESVALLGRHSPGLDAEHRPLPIPDRDRAAMRRIGVDLLGGLPLALDVTGALVAEDRESWVHAEIRLSAADPLDDAELAELEGALNLATGHTSSLIATFRASIEHLADGGPAARASLSAVAAAAILGAGRDIPKALVEEVVGTPRSYLPAARLSLLTVGAESVRVHALIGAVMARSGALMGEAIDQARERIHAMASDPVWVADFTCRQSLSAARVAVEASEPEGVLADMVRRTEHDLRQLSGAGIDRAAEACQILAWDALRHGATSEHEALCRALTEVGLPSPAWTSEPGDDRLRRVLAGHEESIYSVALHNQPDGSTLVATGSGSGSIRVWDAATGLPIGAPIPGHEQETTAVALHQRPSGQILLASCSLDRTIRLWDAATGQALGQPIEGHTSRVTSISLLTTPSGQVVVAAGSTDGTAWIFDTSTGEPLGCTSEWSDDWVSSVALLQAPDGRTLLATGCFDGTARLWDATAALATRTGRFARLVRIRRVRKLTPTVPPIGGHDAGVTAVVLHTPPDGQTLLATCSMDGTARVWDAATGQSKGKPVTDHEDQVLALSMLTDANGRTVLASGSADGTARLTDAVTGDPIGHPLVGHTSGVVAVSLLRAPAGELQLATASFDGTVRLWDVRTGQLTAGSPTGHTNSVDSIALVNGPEQRLILATSSGDGTAILWRPSDGLSVGDTLLDHRGRVNCVALCRTPGGRALLATGSANGTVQLWDATSGRYRGGIEVTEDTWDEVFSIALVTEASGRMLLATASGDGAVRTWDVSSRRPRSVSPVIPGVSGLPGTPIALAHGSDGRSYLATGQQEGSIQIWDANTGRRLGSPIQISPKGLPSPALATGPDGHLLMASTNGQGSFQVYDVTRRRPLSRIATPDPNVYTRALAIQADSAGRVLLAVGSSDGRVRLLNALTGESLSPPIISGTREVGALALHIGPDGRTLLAADCDYWARIWRLD